MGDTLDDNLSRKTINGTANDCILHQLWYVQYSTVQDKYMVQNWT